MVNDEREPLTSPLHQPDRETLVAWDAAHSWHPFTPMQQYLDADPVFIQRGDGIRVQDVDGRWYIDGSSSIWLNVHGHRVASIDEAIRTQLDRIAHSTMLGQANVPATLLARRLAQITPEGLTRAHFSDSGATAVEIALKMAIQYWANIGQPSKRKIVGFDNNYHGDTLGAMSVAPDPLFHWPFINAMSKHPRVPYPASPPVPLVTPEMRCPPATFEPLRKVLEEAHGEIAAVIIEPVEGAGGIHPAPPGYLAGLRALCDAYDVLLIVDEVATGFGRTGWPFACVAEGVTPDLLCLGKGLTGGYLPVAATMATERLYEAFLGPYESRRTLFHGHSYAGNQLGCAAALANIDTCESLWPTLRNRVETIHDAVRSLLQAPYVGEVRHRGLMLGLELMADPATRQRFHWSLRAGYAVTDAARQHGLLIRPIGSTVILMPPLVSSDDDLREMVAILGQALEDAEPRCRAWADHGVATS